MRQPKPHTIDRIGIGVWGIGDHASRTILPAISEVPNLHLVCIGSRTRTKVGVEAEKWGCSAVTSLQDLVDFPNVEVVIIATPIGCHASNAATVLEAGKHIWCEKAFTQNLDEATRILEISRNNDLALCVSCPPLYHSLYRRLILLLSESAIGRVHNIDAHFGFPHVSGHSRYDPSVGGGALLDIGFYPLVVGASIVSKRVSVESALLEIESGFDLDTAGTALLRFSSGVHLIGRWGYGRDYINEIQVFGETGSIRVTPAFSKPPNLPLTMTIQQQGQIKNIVVKESNQFSNMLGEFALTIKDASLREYHREKAIEHQRLISQVQTFLPSR